MNAVEFNALWIMENLPDSTSMRRKLLQNILATTPGGAVRKKAFEMLSSMDCFDAQQISMPLLNAPGAETGAPKLGDGDGEGDGHHGQ